MFSSTAPAMTGSFPTEALPVVWPLVAVLVAGLLFLQLLRKRSGHLDVFELGFLYALVVALYAVFPLISYLISGLSFSPLSDIRLYKAQPLPRELAPIFWYYFLYFGAFACFYGWFRTKSKPVEMKVITPSRYTLLALVLSLLLIKGFFLFVRLIYGLSDPETYNETYLMYRGLPRIVQQMANHFGGILFTLEILIMACLVFNFRKYKYWILGWIGTELISIYLSGVGSRTGLFVLLLSLVACYHFTIKRIRVRTAVVAGVVVLILFVSLGVVRDLTEINSDTGLNPLAYGNEFESIFANAYDLSQLKAAGETRDIFPRFYFADLLNLIPQQLLPFKKLDVGAWYANTFYPTYAEGGGAFAFGAIPEAIVGLGWIDALWRGAVIGILFAYLHRRFLRRRQTFWSYGFYLWVLVFAYQCFRGGTFLLVPRAFYQFVLVFIWIRLFVQALALLDMRQSLSFRSLAGGSAGAATLPRA